MTLIRLCLTISFFCGQIFYTFAASAAEGPTAAEYGIVLNLSGKQRMLSQKMSKEVLLIALNVERAANLEQLQKTANLFDKTLNGLKNGDANLGLPPTTSRRITRQLDKVTSLWTPFYERIKSITNTQSVSKNDITFIAANNLPLLSEMNRCVKLYEKDAAKAGLKADPSLAITLNLSGKQRMLTQKMSKEFLLIAYGHEQDDNRLAARETATLFERTLKGLLDGDETLELPGTTTAHIREQLTIVQDLWVTFKPNIEFAMDPANTNIPKEKIYALSAQNIPLLKEMNRAVGMYEKQAGK